MHIRVQDSVVHVLACSCVSAASDVSDTFSNAENVVVAFPVVMLLSCLARFRLLMLLAQVEDVTDVAFSANAFPISRLLVLATGEHIADSCSVARHSISIN